MTEAIYRVKEALIVNGAVTINSGGVYFTNAALINSSFFTGTAAACNNALYLGGRASSIIIDTVNNFQTNGVISFANNVVLQGPVQDSNNSTGTANQALLSTGTKTRWTTLASSAFVNALNANNINAGTLAKTRLPSDILYSDVTGQLISGGAYVNTVSIAPDANGNVWINSSTRPLQYLQNNEDINIEAPTSDGTVYILLQNSANAGSVSFTGFYVYSDAGDTIDTDNGSLFFITCARIWGISTYNVVKVN